MEVPDGGIRTGRSNGYHLNHLISTQLPFPLSIANYSHNIKYGSSYSSRDRRFNIDVQALPLQAGEIFFGTCSMLFHFSFFVVLASFFSLPFPIQIFLTLLLAFCSFADDML